MKRIFVRKKEGFRVEEKILKRELLINLEEDQIKEIAIYNIYDIYNIEEWELDILKEKILSEKVVDTVSERVELDRKNYIATELLPGQYDSRGEWAKQCMMLFSKNKEIDIKCGKLVIFEGEVKDIDGIKQYMINPIEKREKNLESGELYNDEEGEKRGEILEFNSLKDEGLESLAKELSLTLNLENLKYIQNYFKNIEKREPTRLEIKIFDTYWSDHCRHTTFETILKNIDIKSKEFKNEIEDSFNKYLKIKGKKNITLMDIATSSGKYLRKIGELENLDVSDEINACSIEVDVDVDGEIEKWLLLFKNETHNHPTEIEPFGGASTCIGGAIRDPLSGRAYVYQGMRISGAGDITEKLEETLANKLPQQKISKEATLGFSSYGNQIGIGTSFVREVYDDGYKAKRMEVGAVVGAVKKEYVRREKGKVGDIIILLGGKTGRDGIGGATGSSKAHDRNSLKNCVAEVQKGDAVTERKIQKLFKRKEVLSLIKRCNDFGAGGVIVAIGELATGVKIDLDKIRTKYNGISGEELALSESQERMGVIIERDRKEEFLEYLREENIEGEVIAEVIEDRRMILNYRGEEIANISKEFLDTNGILPEQDVEIVDSEYRNPFIEEKNLNKENILGVLENKNVASQRGMIEYFDSTIGRGTVIMPFGGKYQLSESEGSVQKIAVDGYTESCSILTYGYNVEIFKYSPYLGGQYSVIESLAKIVALGGDYRKARLSFQEYFEKLRDDKKRWGKVTSALLGGVEAQLQFKVGAIGGKDSMSGSYEDIDVPPTLISFAVTTEKVENITSTEFKEIGNKIYYVRGGRDEKGVPNYENIKSNFAKVGKGIRDKKIISTYTLKYGGIIEGLFKMSFGNKIGVKIVSDIDLFSMAPGDFIVESRGELEFGEYLGEIVGNEYLDINGIKISIDEGIEVWEKRYKDIYPTKVENKKSVNEIYSDKVFSRKAKYLYEKPKVLIIVFPGTNCELDSKKAFEKAGGEVEIFTLNNLNYDELRGSIDSLSKKIEETQILMFPGGFSAGDEPDGSGKFIANIIQNEKIKKSIENLLERDGLILGICNGFQALVKSGLLPYGKIGEIKDKGVTLFRNDINRHISRMGVTKIVSLNSPWLNGFKLGDIHTIPLSHGEGKFVVEKEEYLELLKNGQIVTQYCSPDGDISMDGDINLNGSEYSIEGLVSKCGRIFGKMGHSERYENGNFKNIYGYKFQNIFKNGIEFFKK